MYEALSAAVEQAAADAGVRALVFAGQPGIFTAGNDLEDFLLRPPGPDSPVFRFMNTLMNCDKPVLAAVTGTAIGIGVTMLLHCDPVSVSQDAELAMPFVALGRAPSFASSLILPQLIGSVRAAEKLLLGERFTAQQAVELGMANAALPAADVLAHTQGVAERFNNLPPGAVRDTKRLLPSAPQRPVPGPASPDRAEAGRAPGNLCTTRRPKRLCGQYP